MPLQLSCQVCGYSAEEIPGDYVNTVVLFYSCERTRTNI